MSAFSVERIFITSNDGSFGYTDTIHNAILFTDTSTMLDTTKQHWQAIFSDNNGKKIIVKNHFKYICFFLSCHGFTVIHEKFHKTPEEFVWKIRIRMRTRSCFLRMT